MIEVVEPEEEEEVLNFIKLRVAVTDFKCMEETRSSPHAFDQDMHVVK